MSRNMAPIWCIVLLAASATTAPAQFGDPCGCRRQPVFPVACQPIQPVAQTCFQSVPVTEYQQVRRTVQKPVTETKYVDREFVEYRPQTETRTADVPQTTYHPVTEYHTVQRDMGQWATQCQCTNKVAPCQYDSRPGFVGWWNRSSYRMRSAFTPNYRVTRHWVPNVVAQQVPVTRQVAVNTTRKVTYNVTKMVAHRTTRKVAVNTVRYVPTEVVESVPVTRMVQVPIGSSLAYGGTGSTTTALAPYPDSLSRQPVRSRTADARNDAFHDNDAKDDRFRREDSKTPSALGDEFGEGDRFVPGTSSGVTYPGAATSQVVPVRKRSDLRQTSHREPQTVSQRTDVRQTVVQRRSNWRAARATDETESTASLRVANRSR